MVAVNRLCKLQLWLSLYAAFRTNSRNIIGRNPSMVIPLLANQDLTPMLMQPVLYISVKEISSLASARMFLNFSSNPALNASKI